MLNNQDITITSHPLVLLGMTCNYLVLIDVLMNFMEERKAFVIKYPMMVYNIFQIFLNTYIFYGLITIISMPYNIFGLNTLYNNNIQYYVYLHYLSKYLDYFDTVFIILRKKNNQLSFLHIYHHSTIGVIWGLLLYIGHGNGTVAFGALINSFIHMIMYTHYLYTSLGYINPLKKYITQAQLTQFIICMIHSFVVMLYEKYVPKYLATTQTLYHISMLYLFNKFYVKSY